jgi:hypothetical protein
MKEEGSIVVGCFLRRKRRSIVVASFLRRRRDTFHVVMSAIFINTVIVTAGNFEL